MLKDSCGSVTSADGTSIGHRMIGEGPGIILVQGAMGTAILRVIHDLGLIERYMKISR